MEIIGNIYDILMNCSTELLIAYVVLSVILLVIMLYQHCYVHDLIMPGIPLVILFLMEVLILKTPFGVPFNFEILTTAILTTAIRLIFLLVLILIDAILAFGFVALIGGTALEIFKSGEK